MKLTPGDIVTTDEGKIGLIVNVRPANNYNSYAGINVFYVMINGFIEGPMFSNEFKYMSSFVCDVTINQHDE